MDKYGLIGFPLGHSFSIVYFNEKFQSEGIDAVYENFEIETIEQLKIVLDTNPELRGLNVTIPYKQEVMKFLHEISPEAQVVGAVNVIRIERKGSKSVLKGFNSDVIGFQQSIEPILESHHKKALILGMGGAAKAVDYVLKKMGLETLYVSRNKAEGAILYDEVDEKIIKDYPVIVNCTPVGMYPNIEECPRLPYHAMDSHTLLYDLLYNPDETMFMKKGKQYGAMVKNGLEMLLLQAFASWEFWHEAEGRF
ncbi:MAG: shikimate dehydrogenase [Prevotella sp.]|nr:shikimate dehydrogenase [Prevotella sp.]